MKIMNVMGVSLAVMLGMMLFCGTNSMAADKGTKVLSTSTVKVHYTLTVDGKVMDSSKERGPLEVKIGASQVIAGFEKGLMGMTVGQKKTIKVSPQDGYGVTDPKAMIEVPKKDMPANSKVEKGMTLYAQKGGQSVPVRVVEVKKDTVLMDFNHPLAGKTLSFDLEVVEIK